MIFLPFCTHFLIKIFGCPIFSFYSAHFLIKIFGCSFYPVLSSPAEGKKRKKEKKGHPFFHRDFWMSYFISCFITLQELANKDLKQGQLYRGNGCIRCLNMTKLPKMPAHIQQGLPGYTGRKKKKRRKKDTHFLIKIFGCPVLSLTKIFGCPEDAGAFHQACREKKKEKRTPIFSSRFLGVLFYLKFYPVLSVLSLFYHHPQNTAAPHQLPRFV